MKIHKHTNLNGGFSSRRNFVIFAFFCTIYGLNSFTVKFTAFLHNQKSPWSCFLLGEENDDVSSDRALGDSL